LAIVAVGNAARAVQPKQIWIELDCLASLRWRTPIRLFS
jgi:hypothetical protein